MVIADKIIVITDASSGIGKKSNHRASRRVLCQGLLTGPNRLRECFACSRDPKCLHSVSFVPLGLVS